MKIILMLLIFGACTQKYQTYHTIDKMNFDKEDPQTPITGKLKRGRKTSRDFCAGQFFFFSNSKKDTDKILEHTVRSMCPEQKYLLDSRLTETWWTTIIYSRSCVEFETYCSR